MHLLARKNGRFVINYFLLVAFIGALLCLAGCGGSSGGGGGGSNGGGSNGGTTKVVMPVASVPSGGIVNEISVSLSTKTSGAEIYYTMDGTEPTRESELYTEPFVVDDDLMIKAFAVKSGLDDSAVVTYTYIVGDDIPGLIDTLDSGSAITAPPGTYTLNVDFGGKDLVLRSADPDDPAVVAATILDGGGDGPVINFSNGEGSGAVVEGFTIRNGGGKDVYNNNKYYGGGIYIESASPVIRKNVITGNAADTGGGIYIVEDCAPQIRENDIIGNHVSSENIGVGYGGGGIMVRDNKQPAAIIEDNRINGNDSEKTGGGVQIRDSAVIVRGNEICENTASGGGGIGVRLAATDVNAPQIENNFFQKNSAGSISHGGGLYLINYVENLDFTVKGNEFVENSAGFGGGVATTENMVKFENNTFLQNTASTRGGGLYVNSNSHATIKNNTFDRNEPDNTYDEYSGELTDEGGNTYIND